MNENIKELHTGCYIEKVPNENFWGVHCIDGSTGESVPIYADRIGYTEHGCGGEHFTTEQAAIDAAESYYFISGLGSKRAKQRVPIAILRLAGGDFKAEITDQRLWNAVEPMQQLRYLASQGWERFPANERKDGVQIWAPPPVYDDRGNPLTTAICLNRGFSDYARNVSWIVKHEAERRGINQIPLLMEILKMESGGEELIQDFGKEA